jgi:hypothetical protein
VVILGDAVVRLVDDTPIAREQALPFAPQQDEQVDAVDYGVMLARPCR